MFSEDVFDNIGFHAVIQDRGRSVGIDIFDFTGADTASFQPNCA
jgi:hypothetical protein